MHLAFYSHHALHSAGGSTYDNGAWLMHCSQQSIQLWSFVSLLHKCHFSDVSSASHYDYFVRTGESTIWYIFQATRQTRQWLEGPITSQVDLIARVMMQKNHRGSTHQVTVVKATPTSVKRHRGRTKYFALRICKELSNKKGITTWKRFEWERTLVKILIKC